MPTQQRQGQEPSPRPDLKAGDDAQAGVEADDLSIDWSSSSSSDASVDASGPGPPTSSHARGRGLCTSGCTQSGCGASGRLGEALLLLLAVSCIWVGASQLVHSLSLSSLPTPLPWTLTYVNVAEFTLLLPLQYVREWVTGKRSDWAGASRAAAFVCPVWYLAQGTYNASLSSTSVASSTMLSTTSCAFTLALALALGQRPPWHSLWRRVLGVALVLAGAAWITSNDVSGSGEGQNGGGSRTAYGDALALASAALYALYTTMIGRFLGAKEEDGGGEGGASSMNPNPHPSPARPAISMNAFFGLVGVYTLLAMGPWVSGLWAAGVEDPRPLLHYSTGVTLPGLSLSLSPLALILGKGLLDNVLSDLLWARAVKLTSPQMGTIALSLTIPLALASDALLGPSLPTLGAALGGGLILAGFLTAARAEGMEQEREGADEGPAVVADKEDEEG